MDARDIFAYTVRLRWRLLDALKAVPPDLLTQDTGTNHHTILQTLIHVMAVEQSWIAEDLEGQPPLEWERFRERYLANETSLQAIADGWRTITEQTVTHLTSHPDLTQTIETPGPLDTARRVTVEQIIYHLAGEEMIHMGEILAMTRQLGIDLPAYFLLSVMDVADRPWRGMALGGVRAPVALITGGSRGIGAATALELATRGHDVAITFRNKAARAGKIAIEIRGLGRAALSLQCDITQAQDVDRLVFAIGRWSGRLDVLVLNASGGLERDMLAQDPTYPRRINRDAQLTVLDRALPLMSPGGTVVFVTSHWAHLYGEVEQLPAYEAVGRTKREGENALRARHPELAGRGIRLLIVSGDLVEGTITPRLLERAGPGMSKDRRDTIGNLPTAEDMGIAIAQAMSDESLPSGHTIVVGGALDTLPRLHTRPSITN